MFTHPGEIVIVAGMYFFAYGILGAVLTAFAKVVQYGFMLAFGREADLRVRTRAHNLFLLLAAIGGASAVAGAVWAAFSTMSIP